MKVILQKNVPNLGDAGDIKEVAAGFARNYLLPRKLVIPAQVGSTRAALHQKQLIKRKIEKRSREMSAVADSIKKLGKLEIKVRVGSKGKLFGSVTAMTVAMALKEQGIELDKRKVELGEKIKGLGHFKIKIRLAEDIVVPMELTVVPDEASQEAMAIEEKEAEALAARVAAAAGVDARGESASADESASEDAADGESSEAESKSESDEESSDS